MWDVKKMGHDKDLHVENSLMELEYQFRKQYLLG